MRTKTLICLFLLNYLFTYKLSFLSLNANEFYISYKDEKIGEQEHHKNLYNRTCVTCVQHNLNRMRSFYLILIITYLMNLENVRGWIFKQNKFRFHGSGGVYISNSLTGIILVKPYKRCFGLFSSRKTLLSLKKADESKCTMAFFHPHFSIM